MAKLLFPILVGLGCLTLAMTPASQIDTAPSVQDCISSVPGSISPNGDGINDRFLITYSCMLKGYQLQIRDQSGKVVFTSENPNHLWDGSVQGVPLPQGYYYWEMSYQIENRWVSRRGKVAIVR